jgi:hypothetical protein
MVGAPLAMVDFPTHLIWVRKYGLRVKGVEVKGLRG